ncbi:MAG: aryl-sulfate sulfotransferase [Candidatus Omnitrophica bacterium]|nr:aryl-sulfate sulfotransferase [Candidatus Omnitrophota bacterium]
MSLPYLCKTPIRETDSKEAVTFHDENLSYKGYNLFVANNEEPKVYLIDMEGNVINEWSVKNEDISKIGFAEFLKDGNLILQADYDKLYMLDWESNIRWVINIAAHHDADTADNGDIFVLTYKWEIILLCGLPVPIKVEYVTVLSKDGDVKNEISLLSQYKDVISVPTIIKLYHFMLNPNLVWKIIEKGVIDNCFFDNDVQRSHLLTQEDLKFDVYHTNSVESAERDIDGLCEKGDILVSSFFTSDLLIFNAADGKVVWKLNKKFDGLHAASFLKNGNVLFFENGKHRDYSRVIEVEPKKESIVWQYMATPPQSLFSKTQGSCQRLDNGNTLITESNKGHVFEVTKDGKIVWDYYSPIVNETSRLIIYRMRRIENLVN